MWCLKHGKDYVFFWKCTVFSFLKTRTEKPLQIPSSTHCGNLNALRLVGVHLYNSDITGLCLEPLVLVNYFMLKLTSRTSVWQTLRSLFTPILSKKTWPLPPSSQTSLISVVELAVSKCILFSFVWRRSYMPLPTFKYAAKVMSAWDFLFRSTVFIHSSALISGVFLVLDFQVLISNALKQITRAHVCFISRVQTF